MNTICKTLDERKDFLVRVFQLARINQLVKNQKDFAFQLGIAPATLSLALKGDERYLTDNLETKVRFYAHQNGLEEEIGQLRDKNCKNKGALRYGEPHPLHLWISWSFREYPGAKVIHYFGKSKK